MTKSDRYMEMLRWMNIGARTAHIGAIAVLSGSAMASGPAGVPPLWFWLTIATGDALIVLEWLQDRRWLHRGKGLLTLLHVGLFIVMQFRPGWTIPLLWAILVVGSVCSHMPRRYRHWSVLYGPERREDREPGTPGQPNAGPNRL